MTSLSARAGNVIVWNARQRASPRNRSGLRRQSWRPARASSSPDAHEARQHRCMSQAAGRTARVHTAILPKSMPIMGCEAAPFEMGGPPAQQTQCRVCVRAAQPEVSSHICGRRASSNNDGVRWERGSHPEVDVAVVHNLGVLQNGVRSRHDQLGRANPRWAHLGNCRGLATSGSNQHVCCGWDGGFGAAGTSTPVILVDVQCNFMLRAHDANAH